jgi:glycosyltransferase involved in cell wall biosynthesis
VTRKAVSILLAPKDRFPPFRVDVTVLFARELAARGYTIDWVLQSEKDVPAAYETDYGGGTAWVARTDNGHSLVRRLRKHLLSLRHDFRLLPLARARKYDVVQVKDKILAALIGLRAARRTGAAFVYWLSFPFPESSLYLARIGSARYPLLYRIRGWVLFHVLYRMALPRADHIFVQSEQMKRDLAGYGIDPAKMTAVPMGVEMADFADAPEPTRAAGPPVIAYLGTLAGERRIDFVVRAFAHVCREIPDAKLLLVGDGDRPGDVADIRKEAERLNVLDRLEITGFLPRAVALQRITTAAVCLSPFFPTPILNSTSPTKLIEYMALGLPVVANDHPEQQLVLSESRAGLCVPYDENAFANAIVKIIRAPDEALEMGRRGREYAAKYRDYTHIATLVDDVYQRLVDGRRARS